MTKLDISPLTSIGYDLPIEAADARKLDVSGLDADLIREAEEAIQEYAEWCKTGFNENGYYRNGVFGREEEIRRIAAIRRALDALKAARKLADTISMAREALDRWEPDKADEGEIADVFEAIFGRAPDAFNDPVSDIYAAREALDASEAERLLQVLQLLRMRKICV